MPFNPNPFFPPFDLRVNARLEPAIGYISKDFGVINLAAFLFDYMDRQTDERTDRQTDRHRQTDR